MPGTVDIAAFGQLLLFEGLTREEPAPVGAVLHRKPFAGAVAMSAEQPCAAVSASSSLAAAPCSQ